MLEPLAEPHALEQLARVRGRVSHRRAADEQRHRDVLESRELGQQVMELIDEAERAVAEPPALDVARTRHRLARNADLARRRLVEPAEQL